MSEKATQQEYWNSRAHKWDSYDEPLMPGIQDLGFMRKQLIPAGHTLILGVTPDFCKMALEISNQVTAVDFSKDMIKTLQIENVDYECMEWNEFFDQSTDKFDNIMTDGGLTCIEYPEEWQKLANNISNHLSPGGIFAARVFINTPTPPDDNYKNPNLTRFITGMGRVDHDWMMKVETHDDYRDYDVRYAFPPDQVVLSTFSKLALSDKFIPNYEAGEHFVSYAWQRIN